MPYIIIVRGNTSISEDAAVLTAFNNLMTALRAASSKHVDAGGTVIAGKRQAGDEETFSHLRHGDQF